jgi:hypothetical protein
MGGAISYDNVDIIIFKERLLTDNNLKQFYNIYRLNHKDEEEEILIIQFLNKYYKDPCISLYLANYNMYNKK